MTPNRKKVFYEVGWLVVWGRIHTCLPKRENTLSIQVIEHLAKLRERFSDF
jgi:hypothetical protein